MTDDSYARTDSDTLISWWVGADRVVRTNQDIKGHIEMEIERRMRRDGATEFSHADKDWVVKLEAPPATYSPEALIPLAEMIPPEEFRRGCTPEHTETVIIRTKFDMRVVRSWTKYGTEVADVIEAAKDPPLPSKLRIRPRTKSS